MSLSRTFTSILLGSLSLALALTLSPSPALANGDYVCQIVEGVVSTSGGINCNCTWGPWQPNGKRYCTGTREPSVVISERKIRWGNTRIGCPSGPVGFGYTHGAFRYGDQVSSTTATSGPSLSCQLEQLDGSAPFLEKGTISANDKVLNPDENAKMRLELDDLESGIKNGSFLIRDPNGITVFSQVALQYDDPDRTGFISSESPSIDWKPDDIGTHTLEWSATDFAGNTATGSFTFYVTDAAIAEDENDVDDGIPPGMSLPVCGNAIIESGEQCDDGNLLDTDLCSSSCEAVYMCTWLTSDDNDPNNRCAGEVFQQPNTCGGYREVVGTGEGDCATPNTIADPEGGPSWQGGTVRLHCIDAGTSGCASTYFTTDGSYPSAASPAYTGPFNVPPDTIVRFYSTDTAGNAEDVQTQVYGAGSNLRVYGPIKSSQEVSEFAKAESVGDLSLSEAQTLIAKTTAAFQLMTGCSATTEISGAAASNADAWNSNLASCEKQSGDVLLFDGADVKLRAANDVVTLPTGQRTIFIRGGNLHIQSNIAYPVNDPSASLGIIVLKDAAGNGGNVYLYPNVTNIVGALYAEGTMQSVLYDVAVAGDAGADPRGFIEGTREERAIFLINQILWQGSIVSNNTIGGGESKTPYCPTGFTACNAELAHQYDLASLRYLNRTSGKIAGSIVNGIDLANPPGGQTKDYSIIIQYDTRISSLPPPLFSDGASADTSTAIY